MAVTLLRGETVTVLRPSISYDERMDPVTTWTPESVDNVLFGRPSTEQADGAMRAYGVHAQYVLGIPKEYTASLRGCKVTRARDAGLDDPPEYIVAGDPQPLPPELCPTPWNREAIVGWVDG